MKCLLLLLGPALLLAAPARAQHVPATQVPAAARATFWARFATASQVSWEKEGAAYEVSFRQDGRAMSATLTPAGTLQETETAVPVAQLPLAVRATLARDYHAYQVAEAARIVRANGHTVYEAELRRNGKKQDVLFTASGQPAK